MDPGFASACLPGECADTSDRSHSAHTELGGSGSLDGEGLAHDGAATSDGLQIGHAATTWRRTWVGGGRKGTQSRGRSLFEERTHALGLAKNGVHGGGKIRRMHKCFAN